MISSDLYAQAESLVALCRRLGVRLATAESCTGGLIAAALTAVPGASEVFERGFVTYSNAAKADVLGVAPMLISLDGAVSERVARAMAEGALKRADADLAIAVTGIAGPGGGTLEKPVGLVHFAVAGTARPTAHRAELIPGARAAVRHGAVAIAFEMVRLLLTKGAV